MSNMSIFISAIFFPVALYIIVRVIAGAVYSAKTHHLKELHELVQTIVNEDDRENDEES